MDNQTEVSIKFHNSITNMPRLEKYAETLGIIKSALSGIDKEKVDVIEKTSNDMKDMKKETKQIGDYVKSAFNYSRIREFSRALQRTFKVMSSLSKKSADYLENFNLFEVAFDGSYQQAEKFVNKLTEMYGLDESRLTRTVGIFKQLSNAMGLSVEQGTKLATLLTQMSLDISSLYNIDEFENATAVLQSALAGQTKPIRGATGGDITQHTLQQTLGDLGIDRYVADLSYAEKRLLIIISLTRQLSQTTNDFGRTIENPANQMRILSEQWERLSRQLGNVFMPILAKILPYLNAILMVLSEIVSIIATLLGFDPNDYDTFAGMSDAVIDLEESLDGASESAKKLKQGLRGFDKLNVISTPSNNNNASTGIDPAIMDAFNDAFDLYNSKLTDVTMKATVIRDAIMEWLGFIKEIDKETGKVSFKFEKLTSGTVLGSLAIGGSIYSGIFLISKFLTKIGITTSALPSIFALIKTAVVGIAGALGISVGWVVAIGVAIAGLVALLIIYWDEIKAFVVEIAETVANFFVDLWNNIDEHFIKPIVNFFTTLADFIYTNAIKPIIDFFKPIAEAVVSIFSLIIEKTVEITVGIGKALFSILEKIGEIFLKIVEIFVALGKAGYEYIIKPFIDFIVDLASFLYEKAIKPIIKVFADIGSWFYKNIIKPVWDWIIWLKDKAVAIFKGIGTTVVNFVSDAFKTVINAVLGGIEGAINLFIKMLNGAIDIINAIPGVSITKIDLLEIPRLKRGMDFVPNDYYPAYLDYGERVLTKEENREYMANQNMNNTKEPNMTQIFNIYVGDEEVASVVLDKLDNIAKTNGKPITIGG